MWLIMKEIMTKFKGLDLHEAYLLDVLVLTNFVVRLFAYRTDSFAAKTRGPSSNHLLPGSGHLAPEKSDYCCLESECCLC